MKQILVDMDGVLADVYAQFQKYEKEETGRELSPGEMTGKEELKIFPNGGRHIRLKGFFRDAPTIPGSIEGLKYLNDKYKIFIVSSATEYPHSLREKHDWLDEHYPFISWRQMIFCGDKEAVKGDIMIDDHPKNLNFFDGERILFSQPHNMLINEDSYRRVDSWNDLIDLF